MARTLGEQLVGPTRERLGWRPPLDGMRGASVLVVLLFHFAGGYWFHGGVIGVDLFFVVSGFLITTLLLEEHHRSGGIDLRAFYRRRAHRLFPALYVLLGVTLLATLAALILGGAEVRDDALGVLGETVAGALYGYNLLVVVTGVGHKVLIHLWTLANEEQFYLVWPAVLVFVLRRPVRRTRVTVAVMVAIVATAALARVVLEPIVGPAGDGGGWLKYAYRVAILRPDALFLGCLLAFAWRALPARIPDGARRAIRVGVVAELALLAVIVIAGYSAAGEAGNDAIRPWMPHIPGTGPFGGPLFQVAILGLPLLILDTLLHPDRWPARALAHPRLVAVGKRSYSLYLWHNLVNFAVTGFVAGLFPDAARKVVVLALVPNLVVSFAVAELSYRFIELPGLRRKEPLAPASTTGETAGETA